jgi:hypothetical protein
MPLLQVNGQLTPDLDTFLSVVAPLKDGDFARVKVCHLETTQQKVCPARWLLQLGVQCSNPGSATRRGLCVCVMLAVLRLRVHPFASCRVGASSSCHLTWFQSSDHPPEISVALRVSHL